MLGQGPLGGSVSADGTYTLSGANSASYVGYPRGRAIHPPTIEVLKALVFTPAPYQGAPGGAVTTSFTISYKDTGGWSISDSTTSVVTTAAPSLGPHDVGLVGNHDQYVIAQTSDGQAQIEDRVAGGIQVVPGLQHIAFADKPGAFADGTGVFDPTGTAEVVTRLYQAAFDRTPDLAGLDHNVDLVTSNVVTIAALASSFTTSPEFISGYGSLDDAGFVQQLYRNVLHRAPDVAGNQLWLNFLNSGAGRGEALRGFADSRENRKQILPIAGDKNDATAFRLYQAALGRAPDDQGLTNVSDALAHGATPQQVATGFVNSTEFEQKYGVLTPSDFVTQLYQNVLHRAPDGPGLQSFVGAMANGASREQILVGFSDSTENRINTASATHDAWVFIK